MQQSLDIKQKPAHSVFQILFLMSLMILYNSVQTMMRMSKEHAEVYSR